MKDEVIERGEGVARIFNLVDACNRTGLAFRLASDRIISKHFSYFAEELQKTLDRFSFELLTEIRRINGGELGPPRSYFKSEGADPLKESCEAVLHEIVHEYEKILTRHLPAHARAMIKRQGQSLREMSLQFEGLYRELSA